MRSKLQTSIGEVEYAATDSNHVFIGCASGERVTVRGVEYFTSLHLHLDGGEWVLRNYSNFYVSRDNNKQPSEAARRSICEAFTAAWLELIAAHPEILVEAGRAKRAEEIDTLKGCIAALEAELIEKRAAIEAKKIELAGLTT